MREQEFLEQIVFPFYRQPHRRYHTEHHIEHMLDSARSLNIHLSGVQRLAIYFHDAVYIPGSLENEAASAALMHCILQGPFAAQVELFRSPTKGGANPGSSIIEHASNIILDTKSHLASSVESATVIDLDMLVFAEGKFEYANYVCGIRFEYSQFSDHEFNSSRLKFLEDVLRLKRIYYTQTIYEVAEAKARANIKREIDEIKSGNYGWSRQW